MQTAAAKSFSKFQSNLIFFLFAMMIFAQEPIILLLTAINGAWVADNLYLVSMTVQTAGYLVILAVMAGAEVRADTGWGFRGFKVSQLLLAIATAALSYIVAAVLAGYAEDLMGLLGFGISDALYELSAGLYDMPWWGTALILCVYAPVFEELMFRGGIFSGREAANGPVAAALVTGLLFALIHGYIVSVVALFAAAVMFGLVRGWTGSIWLTMIMHALHNAIDMTGVVDTYVMTAPAYVLPIRCKQLTEYVWPAVLLAVCGVLLWLCLRALKKRAVRAETPPQLPSRVRRKNGTAFFIIGLAAAILTALLITVTYTVRL